MSVAKSSSIITGKLVELIAKSFEGIKRESIEEFYRQHPGHNKKNTVFSIKKTLQPVVCHTVNRHHQMDLVDFTRYPQIREDGV